MKESGGAGGSVRSSSASPPVASSPSAKSRREHTAFREKSSVHPWISRRAPSRAEASTVSSPVSISDSGRLQKKPRFFSATSPVTGSTQGSSTKAQPLPRPQPSTRLATVRLTWYHPLSIMRARVRAEMDRLVWGEGKDGTMGFMVSDLKRRRSQWSPMHGEGENGMWLLGTFSTPSKLGGGDRWSGGIHEPRPDSSSAPGRSWQSNWFLAYNCTFSVTTIATRTPPLTSKKPRTFSPGTAMTSVLLRGAGTTGSVRAALSRGSSLAAGPVHSTSVSTTSPSPSRSTSGAPRASRKWAMLCTFMPRT
mmetsp:Transcript_17291/g.34398  ORF Transcript_17291/g.34398 Transcript_17291/m.34398 type:complete len:307 (-) Transcript_17291:1450-2370(-)